MDIDAVANSLGEKLADLDLTEDEAAMLNSALPRGDDEVEGFALGSRLDATHLAGRLGYVFICLFCGGIIHSGPCGSLAR